MAQEPRGCQILERAIRSIEGAADMDALATALTEAITAMGFRWYAYAVLESSPGAKEPLVLTNFPDSWKHQYLDQSYFGSDPVILACKESVLPLDWAEVLEKHPTSARQKTIMEEAARHGLRHGLTAPVHRPGGGTAYLTVSTDRDLDAYRDLLEQSRYKIQVLAAYFDNAARPLLHSGGQAVRPINLTARELECLQWCGRGKTSAEIADVMRIAERTVNFHLGNAMRKLGVRSRTQAVARLHPMDDGRE